MAENTLIAWFVSDAKPGHRSQLDGLRQALGSRTELAERRIEAGSALHNLRTALSLDTTQRPHLLVACGHRTHILTLALRRRFGGRAVVLMRPSLPLRWFDLCIVPAHDPAPALDTVVRTCGVLNAVLPAAHQDSRQGLILIGGPSKHHGWSNAAIIDQLRQLITALPLTNWTLTTSRRTPADFATALAPLLGRQLQFIPARQTPPGWLPQQLQRCGRVWVSEDSVSMVYESLSSGARVGLLEVPRRGCSRVAAGVDRLLQAHQLTSVAHLLHRGEMLPARAPLQEADRVAKYILAWLPDPD